MKGKLNKTTILLVGGTICILLMLFVIINNNSSSKGSLTSTETSDSTNKADDNDTNQTTGEIDSSTLKEDDSAANTATVTEDTLDDKTKDDIVKLVEDYYTSIPKGDSKDKREGIEAYKDMKSYIRAGLQQDSYIVFSTYNMKFENIDTLAPGMSVLYLEKGDSGYVINKDTDNEELNKYIDTLLQEDAIKKITEKVNDELKAAMDKDATLKDFIEKVESAK